MLKQKIKALVEKNRLLDSGGMEIIHDSAAREILGGTSTCPKLESCQTYTGSCPNLTYCSTFSSGGSTT